MSPISDGYTDRCSLCGHTGYLRRAERSIRETYRCEVCKASLRYREQARVVVECFGHLHRDSPPPRASRLGISRLRRTNPPTAEHALCLADLVEEPAFRNLRIYEPGLIGPFRKLLAPCSYVSSWFWDGGQAGECQQGVPFQDLMNLTFEDNSFDLVLTSDILEHVRKPFAAFTEIERVLKVGGYHIFSIPPTRPMPAATVFRVGTDGPTDVHILPARYHGAPNGGRSLVYTDFGADLRDRLAVHGIDLKLASPPASTAPAGLAERMLTFYWRKSTRPQRLMTKAIRLLKRKRSWSRRLSSTQA